MHQNLEDFIYMKYPFLFTKKERVEGKMYYPISIGIECNDGWFHIINNLCNSIYLYCELYKKPFPDVVQIKEKFGTLRFYINKGDDAIHQLISFAESMTETTCEICGNLGKLNLINRYVQILCEKHSNLKNEGLSLVEEELKNENNILIDKNVVIHDGTNILSGIIINIDPLKAIIKNHKLKNEDEKETWLLEYKEHPIFSYFILKQ